MKRTLIALLFISLLIAVPAAADDWKFDAVLYGWLAGLDGTIGVADVADAPVDATFSDLAGFVDFAMAGHFEAKNATALVIADLAFTGLSSERDAMVENQPVTIKMDLNQWIMELGGGYRATPEFDILLVGRYYILDMGSMSSSIAGDRARANTQDWGDIYIGARYMKTLKEKWLLAVRGDIGTGGSDFAWFGNATVGYRFSQKFSAVLAYRVLSLDRQPDTAGGQYFRYDITQDGLGIGLGYSF
jgi:hypothetical protein